MTLVRAGASDALATLLAGMSESEFAANNVPDAIGDTPLHAAAYEGFPEVGWPSKQIHLR